VALKGSTSLNRWLAVPNITLVYLLGLFVCFEWHGMARDWAIWNLTTMMMMNTWLEGRGEKENQLLFRCCYGNG
jgi:hypothetical protein